MGESKKPPPFYCPRCGQKHRAPIDELLAHPTAVMRTACLGCALPLGVTLKPDGSLSCVSREGEPAAPPASGAPSASEPSPAAPAAPTPAPAPAPASRQAAPIKGSGAPRPQRGKDRPAKASRGKGRRAPKAAQAGGPAASASTAPPAAAPGAPSPSAGAVPTVPAEGADAGGAVEGAEFESGTHIGRYAIEGAIGEGGTSIVYKAFDPTTNRTVALKVLKRGMSDSLRERFLREIEVQANIRHQNIMPVFDRGEVPDGRPYFTMELLYRPVTLEAIVEQRQQGTLGRTASLRPLQELEGLVRSVIVPVAEGMYIANVENGVVHRDLKPGNVLVDSRTLRPYVIDFGICHVLEKKGAAGSAVIPPTTDDAGVVGTPRFLAPEQVAGEVHSRTDVWGLGALLRYCVTGEAPIEAATSITRAELGRRVSALKDARASAENKGDDRKVGMVEDKLSRLEAKDLRTLDDMFRDARDARYPPLPSSTPAPLAAVITKAMAASPADRYVNARQLVADLSSWLEGGRVRALREVGGKAAAVETARRAVRRHTAAVLFALGGAVLGFVLGGLLGAKAPPPLSSRVADVASDVENLAPYLERMGPVLAAGRLTPLEQRLLYETLSERRTALEKRLEGEPDDPKVRSLRERLAFVTNLFAPVLVTLDLPAEARVTARSTLAGYEGAVEVKHGENRLPPGLYEIQIEPGEIRVPLAVPLLIRPTRLDAQPQREPAWYALRLPVTPDRIPPGMVLVVGGRVRARDLPFGPPSPEEDVAPFFLQRAEVSNAAYAEFLRTLPADARAARAPLTGVLVDPEDGGVALTSGAENRPVVGLRPVDAQAYAVWRSASENRRFRLPTEAEWVQAAGGALGYTLPGGLEGQRDDAHLLPPLVNAGDHARDVSPYGVRGMLGNAREMVTPSVRGGAEGEVLVKGAGVGDAPDEGAIHAWRTLGAEQRDPVTGFRLVCELPR